MIERKRLASNYWNLFHLYDQYVQHKPSIYITSTGRLISRQHIYNNVKKIHLYHVTYQDPVYRGYSQVLWMHACARRYYAQVTRKSLSSHSQVTPHTRKSDRRALILAGVRTCK